MSEDAPWYVAADRARQLHARHLECGPTGPDRDALASDSSAHMASCRRSTRQHREATPMTDQLPAVLLCGRRRARRI